MTKNKIAKPLYIYIKKIQCEVYQTRIYARNQKLQYEDTPNYET